MKMHPGACVRAFALAVCRRGRRQRPCPELSGQADPARRAVRARRTIRRARAPRRPEALRAMGPAGRGREQAGRRHDDRRRRRRQGAGRRLHVAAGTGAVRDRTAMYPKLPYDAARDFTGVALLASSPAHLHRASVVGAGTPPSCWRSPRRNRASVMYGSPGNGSVPHLAIELFKLRTGTDFTHVPYKGGGPAVTDLVAGQIGLMFASPLEVSQHVKAGKLKSWWRARKTACRTGRTCRPRANAAIAGTTCSRGSASWRPRQRRRTSSAKLSQEIGRILAAPDVKEKLGGAGRGDHVPAGGGVRPLPRPGARAVDAGGQGLRRKLD